MKILESQFCFGSMAKLNLGLSVLGKVPNGYHQVETIMTKIPLYDEVCLDWHNDHKRITIECDHERVPLTAGNLAYKAYEILQKQFDLPGVTITLQKNIPIAAGLGGGSFNAGLLLKQLNYHLHLGISPAKMRRLCLALGADVPFAAARAGSVYERSHGLPEMLPTYLPSLPSCRVALAVQDFEIATEEAYRHLDTIKFTPSGQNKLMQALELKDLEMIGANLNNDFCELMYRRYPQLPEIKNILLAAGAVGASMTGKGPTMFALFPPGYKIEVPFKVNILELKEVKNARSLR